MEGGLSEIRIPYMDPAINQLLRTAPDESGVYTAHFNQSEDFFVLLKSHYTVPPFPIHHDVRIVQPGDGYLAPLSRLMKELTKLIPALFHDLAYFFDPGDILHPAFFQLFKMGEMHYLYLLKLDLSFRTHEHEMVTKGTNDLTPEYRSRRLFVEGSLVPVHEVRKEGERIVAFTVDHAISSTWIGEAGRGYLIQGIWMDADLTKFFSKLLLPQGLRSYPYYPFVCRYRTVCHVVLHLSVEGRREHVPYLHKAFQFLQPEMRNIEAALRGSEFSEALPTFQAIKERVPEYWKELWTSLKVTPYLNENDMKEYKIEF